MYTEPAADGFSVGSDGRRCLMGCGASSSKYQVADEPKPTSAWAAYVRQDTSHEELLQRVQAHTEAESESTKTQG